MIPKLYVVVLNHGVVSDAQVSVFSSKERAETYIQCLQNCPDFHEDSWIKLLESTLDIPDFDYPKMQCQSD